MHKKLIKKCQYGSYIDPRYIAKRINIDIEKIQANFAKSLSYPKLKTPERPTAPPSAVGSPTSFNMGSISAIGNIAGLIPSNPNSGQNTSSLTAGINKGYDVAADMAIQSGNPYGVAAGAAMKVAGFGKDTLDSLTGGKTTVENAATGIDKVLSSKLGFIAAPWLSVANGLGKSKAKGTEKSLIAESGQYGYGAAQNLSSKESGLFGKLFGGGRRKLRERRAAVKREETKSMLQLSNIYDNKQEELASNNSYQDIYSKNNQSLIGGVNFSMLSAKKGGTINPASLRNIVKKAKKGMKITRVEEIQQNVIPEGALHSRLNHLDGEIGEQVTTKGIPVITLDEGGKVTQHAEIEQSEIIFTLKTTQKVEDLFKKYNETDSEKEKDLIAIECGKFLTEEIINNTDDRVGLLNDENNEINTKLKK